MKKTLLLLVTASLVLSTAVSYSQEKSTTTAQQDAVTVQKASIASLDAQFAANEARYKAQRNQLVRQLEKLQLETNAIPTISRNPTSSSLTH